MSDFEILSIVFMVMSIIVAILIEYIRVCEIKSVNRHSMISDGAVSS